MQIKEKLENIIKKALQDFGIKEPEVILERPADFSHGDFSSNIALAYAKQIRKNPRELAEDIVRYIKEHQPKEIEKVEIAGPGFINFYLFPEYFAESIRGILKQEKKYGRTELLKSKKVFVEHTQPNPFKEFHIGHLMNNAVGESIARIVGANGAKVKTASYHGDKGLHVAKALWGKMKKPELTWGEAYAYGSAEFENNKEEIVEINKKIYANEGGEIDKLYKKGLKASFDYFESQYKKLGSHFDYTFFESESGEVGKELVLKNKGKVFVESEGAVVFKGENFIPKTHTRVFLNKEGLPTYEAKELGLADIKRKKFNYDYSITITGNEQDSFFQVTEVAIGEVFPELKGKLKHLSHGMLRLPSGKMSSRTGDIITAIFLITRVKDKVIEKLKDRDVSDKEKEDIAEIVAIGAIKYSILRQAIGGDIIFDFDKSISFEGDSGPYLQYSAVRAKSVLEKAKEEKLEARAKLPEEKYETTDLERLLSRFPEIVERAAKEYAPHHIVTYLIELAGAFNSFYAKEKIVDKENKQSSYKLALTEAVHITLQNGLNLLGIQVPQRM